MGLAELAAKYERAAHTAHQAGLEAAADDVRAAYAAPLAAHERTGTAEGALSVTATASGVAVDGVRYMKFIHGVPTPEERDAIARAGYARGLHAALEGGT